MDVAMMFFAEIVLSIWLFEQFNCLFFQFEPFKDAGMRGTREKKIWKTNKK